MTAWEMDGARLRIRFGRVATSETFELIRLCMFRVEQEKPKTETEFAFCRYVVACTYVATGDSPAWELSAHATLESIGVNSCGLERKEKHEASLRTAHTQFLSEKKKGALSASKREEEPVKHA